MRGAENSGSYVRHLWGSRRAGGSAFRSGGACPLSSTITTQPRQKLSTRERHRIGDHRWRHRCRADRRWHRPRRRQPQPFRRRERRRSGRSRRGEPSRGISPILPFHADLKLLQEPIARCSIPSQMTDGAQRFAGRAAPSSPASGWRRTCRRSGTLPPDTVQWLLARSSSKSPERARIKPLTTSTHAGKAIATHMLTSPAISSASATR